MSYKHGLINHGEETKPLNYKLTVHKLVCGTQELTTGNYLDTLILLISPITSVWRPLRRLCILIFGLKRLVEYLFVFNV